jgi:hypothetical protein
MAWFNDYSRDYDRAAGYDRPRDPRDRPGMRSTARRYDTGWGSDPYRGGQDRGRERGGYWGESESRPRYGRDYLGRQYGYDSDYDYQYRRRAPEESPFYGRDADRGVRRWANRYGYDMQYEIQPRGGGYGDNQRGSGDRGGYGAGSRDRERGQNRGWQY